MKDFQNNHVRLYFHIAQSSTDSTTCHVVIRVVFEGNAMFFHISLFPNVFLVKVWCFASVYGPMRLSAKKPYMGTIGELGLWFAP